MRHALLFLGLVTILSFRSACAAEPRPGDDLRPPVPPTQAEYPGDRIQRTMTLLATSTAQQRNRVRILFYGQSVTAGAWSKEVADWLRKQYPHADLEIENRAIGGFSAPVLIHTAESDLYPYYPDLLIFHVYGGDTSGELEEIIARTRRRTTAEILIRTPHFRWPKDLARDAAENAAAHELNEADERQAAKIRQIAAKYDCELCDVRLRWREYIKQNGLFPKDLLGDSVHPNPAGNRLLAALVEPHLRYTGKSQSSAWSNMVRDVGPGDPDWKASPDGTLELSFTGNRVDVFAAPYPDKAGSAKVLIDNQAPSQYPGTLYFTRPSNAPDVWWPAISHVDHRAPLAIEKWTLRVLQGDPQASQLRFEITGSQTGPDGTGSSHERFVSRSGRVVIEPKMWNVRGALSYRKKTLPADFQVAWEVRSQGVDVYQTPPAEKPGRQYLTTLVQGISSGPHTLRIIPLGDGAVPLRALRIYRPPLSDAGH